MVLPGFHTPNGIHLDYNWWMVLTRPQFEQYSNSGEIPRYKNSRGDNVHKLQRMHNVQVHAINLAIHAGGTYILAVTLTIQTCQCALLATDNALHSQ
eukprot:881317-Amphidinium_carterae.1